MGSEAKLQTLWVPPAFGLAVQWPYQEAETEEFNTGCNMEAPKPPRATASGTQHGHSHPRARSGCHAVPCSIPITQCLSVCLSPLPPQEALSHHRPACSSPVSCSILPGLPCFFLPPLPLPHSSQAMFAFLSPAVFPLPPPDARSPLHPPQEAAS